jgi:hypothetical protein
MCTITDKFGIISNKVFETEIKKKKYIENYLNNNYICHPDLIKNQNININDLTILLKNHLRKHKAIISKLTRFGKINMDSILQLIKETNMKFNFIKSICDNDFFPDTDQLILNIILINPSVYKILLTYISEKKSLDDFIKVFNNFNKDKDITLELNSKISEFIIESLPEINNNFFSDTHIKDLWNLNKNIDYLTTMINKYTYLSNTIFNDLINIIQNNICECILSNKDNFLSYFKCNSNKFENLLKIVNTEKKLDIQKSLLFFKPSNFEELYDFMNSLIVMKLENKDLVIDNFIKINKHLINKKNIKYITNKIDMNIKMKLSNESNYQFIKNIKFNQDLILANIAVQLMKRYVYFDDFDSVYENTEYNIIKKILPNNILYKYNKVLNDINHSNTYKHLIQYDNNKKDLFSLKYISKSIWDFDYSKGYLLLNVTCGINNVHNIHIFLHLGVIDTNFKTSKGVYNIKMLPIHYQIINYLNNFKQLFQNYSKNYLDFIFKQLVENDLVKPIDNNKFKINEDYDGGDLDLIKLAYDVSNDVKNIETSIYKEVSLERKEIIMANINSILKTSEFSVDKTDIYNKIEEKLNIYFDIEKEYYDIVLQEMIEKEYIYVDTEDTDKIKKLIY